MEKESYQQKIKNLISFIEGINSIQQGNFDKTQECLDLLNNFRDCLESSTPPDYVNIKEITNDGINALKEFNNDSNWNPSLKSRLSKAIMAWLRSMYIYVKNSYIKEFDKLPAVTINPYDERVKLELSEDEKEGTGDEEYTKIYANSFGLFNSDFFFSDDNHERIVWLIKEPFIESDDYETWKVCPDYGGHNQAAEYVDYYKKNGNLGRPNETHPKLVEYTKQLLLSLKILSGEHTLYDVMNHICILEVNHFPGLAFNGNDSDNDIIRDWANINCELIKQLISFYSPNILIGGNTIRHFYNVTEYYFNTLKNYINDKDKKDGTKKEEFLLSKLRIRSYDIKKHTESVNNVIKGVLESNGNPIYVIDAYHPSYRFFDPDYAIKDAEEIKTWRNPRKKTE